MDPKTARLEGVNELEERGRICVFKNESANQNYTLNQTQLKERINN